MAERLSEPLRDRVLERLGFGAPPEPTLAGLNRLYRAWCQSVPFDNVRKRIALLREEPGPLPAGGAEDFLLGWLRHGTGGTCWPSSNALYATIRACGFAARRVSGSMFEDGSENHGTVKVHLDGDVFLADTGMITDRVFPLRRGEKFERDDPLHPIRVEPVGDSFRIRFAFPQSTGTMPCRLVNDPVDHGLYLERYEWSRKTSPFNRNLYAVRNAGDSVLSFLGRNRFWKTGDGVSQTELDEDGLAEALVGDLGLSREIVEELRAHGGLV
jgi:N-hydroxyarylamine O-acetyltransferase